jgi:hypothetical protein
MEHLPIMPVSGIRGKNNETISSELIDYIIPAD